MKRMILAATIPDTYGGVDKVLRKLFNVGYLDHRRKSDWLQTKYGKLRYTIGNAFHDPYSFAIRIYFDPDDLDTNKFRQLVIDCSDSGIYVLSSYINGYDSNGQPQINIKVRKEVPAKLANVVHNLDQYQSEIDRIADSVVQQYGDEGKASFRDLRWDIYDKLRDFISEVSGVDYSDYNLYYDPAGNRNNDIYKLAGDRAKKFADKYGIELVYEDI